MDRRLHEIEEGLERELGALLGSVNFSCYSDRARLRNDDLAVRTAAGGLVLEAKQTIGAAVARWWSVEGGEPTREKPFPDPAVTAKLRRLRAFEQTLGEFESKIRSAPAPDIDAVWSARSDGVSILQTLLSLDKALLERAHALAGRARDVDGAESDPFAALQEPLADLDRIFRERRELLRSIAIR